MDFQLIATYLIILVSLSYSSYHFYRVIKPNKTNSICSNCTSCNIKKELIRNKTKIERLKISKN